MINFRDEGENQTSIIEVTDLAGNTARQTVDGISIDKTPPVINVTQPADGGFYFVGQTVPAAYLCSDNLSGSDCLGTVAAGNPFDTASVGAKSFAVTATDRAGNTTSAVVSYTVGYKLLLLYDPAKANKAGSTAPIKLQLADGAGVNLSSAGTVVHALGVSPLTSTNYGPVNDAGNSNPGQNFRYDPGLGAGGGYIFNLETTGFASGAYYLYFTVGSDTHVYTTQFQIR
jgi:hypothetical protein